MRQLRTVELFRDERRRLVAIESLEFDHSRSEHGGHLFTYLKPLVVIVCTADGGQVLPVEADATGLESLRTHHPELDAQIRRACAEAFD